MSHRTADKVSKLPVASAPAAAKAAKRPPIEATKRGRHIGHIVVIKLALPEELLPASVVTDATPMAA